MWKLVVSVISCNPCSNLIIRTCRLYICLSCNLTLVAVRFMNLANSSIFWSWRIFWACRSLIFFFIFLICIAFTILPIPANMSKNLFSLDCAVPFWGGLGSQSPNLTRVLRIKFNSAGATRVPSLGKAVLFFLSFPTSPNLAWPWVFLYMIYCSQEIYS